MYQKAKDLVPVSWQFYKDNDEAAFKFIELGSKVDFRPSGSLLECVYRHKAYKLAIDSFGVFYGFLDNGRGNGIYPNKEADLIILRLSNYNIQIFERRFTSAAEVEKIILANAPDELVTTAAEVMQLPKLSADQEAILNYY